MYGTRVTDGLTMVQPIMPHPEWVHFDADVRRRYLMYLGASENTYYNKKRKVCLVMCVIKQKLKQQKGFGFEHVCGVI